MSAVANHEIRERGVAVVIRGDAVLMVEHAHPDRTIWTLPGGGIEAGESHERAAVRELLEETCLVATAVTFLTKALVNGQLDYYFLVEIDPAAVPQCGHDPEIAGQRPILNSVRWTRIGSLDDDCQMRVIWPLLPTRALCGDDHPDSFRIERIEAARAWHAADRGSPS